MDRSVLMTYQSSRPDDESIPITRNGEEISVAVKDRKNTCLVMTTIAASALALLLCGRALLAPSFDVPAGIKDSADRPSTDGGEGRKTRKLYDEHGRYVLEDFDAKPTFSDFLPGVAGIYGKPLWSFYVNRGQGIASFGTESKDFPIMEFNAANKAYQNTQLLGFRTFLQGSRGAHSFSSEPFSSSKTRFESLPDSLSILPKRYMYVGANEMQIREVDLTNKIETNVTYFTLPEEDFGSFVRRTTIKNLDNNEPLKLSMLDGLARIEPAGGKINDLLKDMGRTLEGWMGVYRAHADTLSMPFFRMSTEPSDTAAVVVEKEGHYCLSFIEDDVRSLLPIIYDTSKIFGEDTMLLRPIKLITKTVADIIREPQYGFAKTSSSFAAVDSVNIEPGESMTVTLFYGKTNDIMNVPVIARRVTQDGFVSYKFRRAREIINQITAGVETLTGNHLFNGHVQQMFMDNSLRGGIPIILGEEDDQARMSNADEDKRLKVYHLFSRIHGDLERDYNDFVIDPTFFSQGPGAYRDVAQNRRNDVVFIPRIGSFNVKMFLSYIQADGYEPLTVEAVVFTIADKEVCDRIAAEAVGYADGHRAQREALSDMLNSGPFRPGQLFLLMEQQHIDLIMPQNTFIDRVAAAADYFPTGVFGKGFWADHWTYYMDLIESYLSIYPDQEESLMFDEQLPYFFSPASVRPRSGKYVLSTSFDGKGKHVRQLDATVSDKSKAKVQMKHFDNTTGLFEETANWQHDNNGNTFKSSPISKLLLLATLKFATRDVYGMGIEYEGGRPGWNDAMNGLVGMVGSGMPETFELEVLIRYLEYAVSKYQRPVIIPAELGTLIDFINSALGTLDSAGYADAQNLKATAPDELFQYWDSVASAREDYRDAIRTQFSGETLELSPEYLLSFFDSWLVQIEKGKARAISFGTRGNGDFGNSTITPTYFSYNVTKWKLTGNRNKKGHPLVSPVKMSVGRFPLFLEGPVRMMKTVDKKEAINIYNKVKQSGLRDEKLKMYTISASLVGQSYDMGRMMAFSPGWLENQSVWVHMSYKWYLELLRKGLYDQFYEEMVDGMLPFMNPDVYGRSLMECSSFIASSVFMDPSVQGRGFLARLSGSTAEFLSMWVLMMIGSKPFFMDENNELGMQLVPALPLWLFQNSGGTSDSVTQEDDSQNSAVLTISFKLFASINVTYHNTLKTNLYGISPKRYVVGLRDGSTLDIKGPTIPSNIADKIRRVIFVDCIDVYF